jgi:hypothetical protein
MFLDHILIATNDLDQSSDIMTKLGFELTDKGIHRERGTGNRLILFDGAYLELIGVNDLETVKSNRADFLQFLDRKQGLYMFALGDDNLNNQADRLAQNEIITSDVKDSRRFNTDGSIAYEWEYLSIDPIDSPGSETFFIDHKSSFVDRYGLDLDRKHSNGIDHISAITLFVNNVNQSCDQWSKILGKQYSQTIYSADLEAQLYVYKTDNFQLEIATAVESGVVSKHLEKYGDSIGMLTLHSNNIDHTTEILSAYKSIGKQDLMFEVYEGLIIKLDSSEMRICDMYPII